MPTFQRVNPTVKVYSGSEKTNLTDGLSKVAEVISTSISLSLNAGIFNRFHLIGIFVEIPQKLMNASPAKTGD